MSREISQGELRNDSGEPTSLRRRRFVRADDAVAMFRNAPGADFATFRTDLDAVADQDPEPRI